MTEVLKALQELKVYWKKIGHYNMKCRWVPGHREGNSIHGTDYFGDESAIVENEENAATPNVIKFEVQVIILIDHSIFIVMDVYTYQLCEEHANL